jgi:hypothetical protein
MNEVVHSVRLIWFSIVSIILVLAGIVFGFFGLAILPVDREIVLPWESAIYGAIMMGWARHFCVSDVSRFDEMILIL